MRVVDLCAERLQKSDGKTVITAVMETDFLGGGGWRRGSWSKTSGEVVTRREEDTAKT